MNVLLENVQQPVLNLLNSVGEKSIVKNMRKNVLIFSILLPKSKDDHMVLTD